MLSKSILTYQGPLSFSTIDWLLSEFKLRSQEHGVSFRAYKKMLSIMIEALENITKYGDQVPCGEEDRQTYSPACFINRNASILELITMNPVRQTQVESLRSRIDHINQQDREELIALYKSTITDGQFTEKGGAGLGFIEMAKTAGNKLEYSFEKLTEEYSMYTFRVVLDM
jgi:hypothetical protein